MSLQAFLDAKKEIAEHEKYNQLDFYKPYPFQTGFHHATPGTHVSPFDMEGNISKVRTLLAGNKTGKTWCGAYEVAIHLTGLYPDWWDGIGFPYPVEVLVAGVNSDKTRDICQKMLFGEPTLPEVYLGTGTVPKHLIGKTTRKPGVQNTYDNVLVKHITGGWSKVMFQAYEQKKGAFMGIPIDVGWMDEEPPQDVYNQFVRGVIAKGGKYTLMLTFTAENGGTDLVYKTLNEPGPNEALIRAGWKDAPHIWDVEGKVLEMKSLFPKYEWKMRENGDPVVGTGRVFDISEEDITVESFEIPAYYKRIIGIDYGMEHPFVACWIALNPDTNVAYVYHIFAKSNMSTADMCAVLKSKGDLPVAWPHDMAKRAPGVAENKSGQTIKGLFVEGGVSGMLDDPFTNPPGYAKEGSGGNSVSAGILAMQTAFDEGELKVFDNLPEWFNEFRNYHVMDGVIVKKHDDIMDATRYAFQSRRYAKAKNATWGSNLEYKDERAIV